MPLQSGGYTFKPHEMPFMPGSPASPEHPKKRRLAYLAIGLLLALSSGFQNGLLTASLPQLRGDLSLDLQQGGWIQAAYFMAYACMSVLFFKVRKAYGLQRFVRITLFAQLAASLLQLVYHHYEVQLIACVAAAIAASGLLVLSIYYMMQGFTGTKKLVGLVFGLGLMQVGTPLAQSLVPLLYGDGNLNGVFAFQATLALACTACLFALPLPPGITVRKSFTLTDALSFTLFASGIALLCAFLVQGRTVWWTTQWLGWLLAGGVGLTGLALYIESTRHKPMLDWHWMTVPQILIFAVMGAMARLLTSLGADRRRGGADGRGGRGQRADEHVLPDCCGRNAGGCGRQPDFAGYQRHPPPRDGCARLFRPRCVAGNRRGHADPPRATLFQPVYRCLCLAAVYGADDA